MMHTHAPATPDLNVGPVSARFETRFGPLEARDSTVIEFPEGIPGFERCRRWVLIGADELAPLGCLLSLDAPEPSFLVVDPALVVPDYQRRAATVARLKLAAAPGHALLWLSIVTLTENARGSVNLQAPIVVDTARMSGRQVILDDPAYPVDFAL